MAFDYEKLIWAGEEATQKWSDATNVRLKKLLQTFKNVAQPFKILEVGCGGGAFIKALKRSRPDFECYGADISSEAVSLANQDNYGVNFSHCGESSLPYEDGVFDAVFFMDVLEHVSWPENFLNEICRVLKRGGVLFSFVPCEGDILSLWRWLDKIGQKNNITKDFAGHINYFSRKDVLQLLDNSGFLINNKSYSEHFIGQIIGAIAFFGMRRRYKKTGEVVNNEKFFKDLSGNGGKIYSIIREIINRAITLESVVLSGLPSPNMFVKAIKK